MLLFLVAGTAGEPVTLLANFYRLESQPDWCIYHYHVEFSPNIDSKRVRQGIVREHGHKFVGDTFLFDGMALYTITRSPNEVCEIIAWITCYISHQVKISLILNVLYNICMPTV